MATASAAMAVVMIDRFKGVSLSGLSRGSGLLWTEHLPCHVRI
jgi:hypothetical protein